jgi:hypothetical protein
MDRDAVLYASCGATPSRCEARHAKGGGSRSYASDHDLRFEAQLLTRARILRSADWMGGTIQSAG